MVGSMEEIVWDEANDVEYYRAVRGNEELELEPRHHMAKRISGNFLEFVQSLDRAINLFWDRPEAANADALSVLSVDIKLNLIRPLVFEASKRLRISDSRRYVARFEHNLNLYAEVTHSAQIVLQKFVKDPESVWLRELVDLDDWLMAAKFLLDESIKCEKVQASYSLRVG
jgi:hypothetical protein